VILFDGSLECAGTDKAGQLGDGVPGGTSSKLVSAAAFDKAGIKVTAVATGVDFTCVLSSTNKVFCVGQGTYGQLGHGKLESSAEPVAVQGLRSARITQLVAGWNHAAVLYEDGSVQVRTSAAQS
jgi:alpha-tubulin suppressor-like RCC1 family protein